MTEDCFAIECYPADLRRANRMELFVAVDAATAAAEGWTQDRLDFFWYVTRGSANGLLLPLRCQRCEKPFRPGEDVLAYGGGAGHGEQEPGGTGWEEIPSFVHLACMAGMLTELQLAVTRLLLSRFPTPEKPPRRRRKGAPPPESTAEPGVLGAVRTLLRGDAQDA